MSSAPSTLGPRHAFVCSRHVYVNTCQKAIHSRQQGSMWLATRLFVKATTLRTYLQTAKFFLGQLCSLLRCADFVPEIDLIAGRALSQYLSLRRYIYAGITATSPSYSWHDNSL